MDIDIRDKDTTVEIIIDGDIEMMSIKNFKQKLMDVGQNRDVDIDLDLSNVDYIDSSGVGVLISLLKLQKKKGKLLNISKVSPKVLNVLKLSSLSEVFKLEE
ncbi:MAG: STAS domain-containing protein [Spirochaetota bacterium]